MADTSQGPDKQAIDRAAKAKETRQRNAERMKEEARRLAAATERE
jgi:hypothetical protein